MEQLPPLPLRSGKGDEGMSEPKLVSGGTGGRPIKDGESFSFHHIPKDRNYHLESIRMALTIDFLGGVKAKDSHMMQDAIEALMEDGMKLDEIIAAYEAKWPVPSPDPATRAQR